MYMFEDVFKFKLIFLLFIKTKCKLYVLQRNILCFNKMIQPSSVKKKYSWCNCYRYIVLRKSLVSFFLKPKNNWLTLIRGRRVHCCWPTLLPSFEFPHQTNFIKHAMVICHHANFCDKILHLKKLTWTVYKVLINWI